MTAASEPVKSRNVPAGVLGHVSVDLEHMYTKNTLLPVISTMALFCHKYMQLIFSDILFWHSI